MNKWSYLHCYVWTENWEETTLYNIQYNSDTDLKKKERYYQFKILGFPDYWKPLVSWCLHFGACYRRPLQPDCNNHWDFISFYLSLILLPQKILSCSLTISCSFTTWLCEFTISLVFFSSWLSFTLKITSHLWSFWLSHIIKLLAIQYSNEQNKQEFLLLQSLNLFLVDYMYFMLASQLFKCKTYLLSLYPYCL